RWSHRTRSGWLWSRLWQRVRRSRYLVQRSRSPLAGQDRPLAREIARIRLRPTEIRAPHYGLPDNRPRPGLYETPLPAASAPQLTKKQGTLPPALLTAARPPRAATPLRRRQAG